MRHAQCFAPGEQFYFIFLLYFQFPLPINTSLVRTTLHNAFLLFNISTSLISNIESHIQTLKLTFKHIQTHPSLRISYSSFKIVHPEARCIRPIQFLLYKQYTCHDVDPQRMNVFMYILMQYFLRFFLGCFNYKNTNFFPFSRNNTNF